MNSNSFQTPRTSASSAVSYPKRLIEVDLPIKRISAHALDKTVASRICNGR